MMHQRCVLILLSIFWLGVPRLGAAERPAIQVVFDFAEKQYRRQLGSAADVVEHRALELILGDLNRRVPFLRFTSETRSAKLHVQLGNPAGGSEMHDVNFQLSVDGTESESSKPLESGTVRWSFRPASAYDSPLGSAEALATEVGLKFQQGDHIGLVRNVLSAVPISHDGTLVEKDPIPVWVIPFTKDDLCMDFPSRLKIVDELQTSVGRRSHELHVVANGVYEPADPSVPASFEHRILSTPADPPLTNPYTKTRCRT